MSARPPSGMDSAIDAAVADIVADQLLSDRLRQKLDDPSAHALLLGDDLNLDSLDIVEITMQIESDFNVSLSEDAVDTWVCIGDVQRAVHAAVEAIRR